MAAVAATQARVEPEAHPQVAAWTTSPAVTAGMPGMEEQEAKAVTGEKAVAAHSDATPR